jgi:hypothetical protein
VQAQVATWRALLDPAVVGDGRQLLNEILEGPLRFTPEGQSYRFVGPVATGRLIAGMVGLLKPRAQAAEHSQIADVKRDRRRAELPPRVPDREDHRARSGGGRTRHVRLETREARTLKPRRAACP